MGSRTRSGVSPGKSRAITGAAVGPGSISGLSRKDANEVLSRAEKLRGDNFTPETVRIASEFLGLPDRSRPSLRRFALPPSERDKDLLTQQFIENIKKINAPPSMTISQTPNTPPPGLEIFPINLPSTPPPGLEPQETFPNTPFPGTPDLLPELPKELGDAIRGKSPFEGIGEGLQGIIIKQLFEKGLL